MTSYEFPPVGGGGGQVARAIAQRLVAFGNEVDFVTMGFPGLSRVEKQSRLKIYRVPNLRRSIRHCSVLEAATYLIGAVPIILKLLRERQYNILHSHFIFPDGLLGLYAARVAKLPFIITAHGTDVPNHNPYRVKFLHKSLRPLWRLLTSSASQIVCPSKTLRSLVENTNPRARTTIIPNGIDSSHFNPNTPKTKRILSVARMVRSKGLQYLLQALQGFRSDYEIVIVGDGPYGPELKKLATKLAVQVNFAGWLDNKSIELRRLYETSRIFVFPSEAENCPLSLLEAMAAGSSIVTTKGTGCSDIVGDSAILVPPRDSAAIRLGLEKLASHPELAEELGSAARTRFEHSFSWKLIMDRYCKIYTRYAQNV